MNTTATVLLSAHYDSRGSFGSLRAPGADDDGSGTTALLAIARTIARKGVKFHSNVELVAFAGEEQGLLGSKAYSSKPWLNDISKKLENLRRGTTGSKCQPDSHGAGRYVGLSCTRRASPIRSS